MMHTWFSWEISQHYSIFVTSNRNPQTRYIVLFSLCLCIVTIIERLQQSSSFCFFFDFISMKAIMRNMRFDVSYAMLEMNFDKSHNVKSRNDSINMIIYVLNSLELRTFVYKCKKSTKYSP